MRMHACRDGVHDRIQQKLARFKSTAAAQHGELQRKEADAASAARREVEAKAAAERAAAEAAAATTAAAAEAAAATTAAAAAAEAAEAAAASAVQDAAAKQRLQVRFSLWPLLTCS